MKRMRHSAKVCAQCGKVETAHWKRHWQNQHKGVESKELVPGETPIKPWAEDWFEELPKDLQFKFELPPNYNIKQETQNSNPTATAATDHTEIRSYIATIAKSLTIARRELNERLKLVERRIVRTISAQENYHTEPHAFAYHQVEDGHWCHGSSRRLEDLDLSPYKLKQTMLKLKEECVFSNFASKRVSRLEQERAELEAVQLKLLEAHNIIQSARLPLQLTTERLLPRFTECQNIGDRQHTLLKKRKKKAFRRRLRDPPKLTEAPAKFEYEERGQVLVTAPPSAVQTVPPLTLENGTKKKWSVQWVRVSVKALSPDDQLDLTKVLKIVDAVRARISLMSGRIEVFPLDKLRNFLENHVAGWRNTVKHRLEEFIRVFTFPLKELDTEGRFYRVFFEDFPDPTLNRTFSVRSKGPVHGDFGTARVNLEKAVESIDKEIDFCSKILMTLQYSVMQMPHHHREVLRLVEEAETLAEFDEGLDRLAAATEEELDQDHKKKMLKRKLFAVTPLKEYVVKSLKTLGIPSSIQ